MSRALFDALTDRLIFLSADGRIIHANQAAKDALQDKLSGIERTKPVVQALRDVVGGRRQAPMDLTTELIHAGGLNTITARLVMAPNGKDFVLVVPASDHETEIRTAIDTFLDLVRNQLVSPMREMQRRCATLEGNGQLPESTQELARDLTDKLAKLLDLVEVLGRDALVGDDRVLVDPLVREVLESLAPQAARYRVQVVTTGLSEELPPIYGSRDWLRRALGECVENAYKHAREECGPQTQITVEIRARQNPEHVLLQIINQGACPFGLADGKAVPFLAQAPEPPARSTLKGAKPATPPPAKGLKIGLALAQKIVEMHDGHLRFERTDEDMTEVRIELPTGGSRRRNDRLDALQAQRYAEDLARLMQRRRPASTAPGATA